MKNIQLENLREMFKRLRLSTVYDQLNELLEDPDTSKMSHIDLLHHLMQNEINRRDENATNRRLKEARLPVIGANISNIDFSAERKLDEVLVKTLGNCAWIEKCQNCIIVGKTGCGKTWLAGAYVNAACQLGYSAYFTRVPALLNELRELTSLPPEKNKLIRKLRTVDLLVLDDWGFGKLDDITRSDLFEIIEHRRGKCSTLFTSVLPVKEWAQYIQDPSYADSMLDRVIFNAHRIEIDGPSMRKRVEYGAVPRRTGLK